MSGYLMQGRFLKRPVLGCGMHFPLEFSTRTGSTLWGVATSEDEARINESIWQILSTRCAVGDFPGEDDSLPTFGSQLHMCLYQKLGPQIQAVIMAYVINAIRTWEKRIELGGVTFLSSALDLMGPAYNRNNPQYAEVAAALEQVEQGIEKVDISYTIIATQQPGNCVYPFYTDSDLVIQGYGYVF